MPIKKCNLCPRKCNALRSDDTNYGGFCGMPLNPVIARAALHFGEETCICPPNGSGAVFFSGCNLKCVFCQNYEISTENKGVKVSVERLAEIFFELEQKNAANINLVNPSHYFYAIKEALKIYRPNIPIIYNSSGYDSTEIINENLFDIYLFDLKYISPERSKKYSKASDYFEYASAAVKTAYKNIGKCITDSNGIMKKGIIVRHLLMPLATNEAIKVINWFCENTPEAYFSLMAQFTPLGKCSEYCEINRKITKREYEKVCGYLTEQNLTNAYIQELSSSGTEFLPDFNGEGVKKT